MPFLLLVVFILQFLLHIVNTAGANTINELKAQGLKREIIRLKRELGKTSAQDDFAKWAKLDRQHNKAMSEYQKLDGSLRTHQTTFNSTISTLRWLGTQGLRFILQFWFAKSPIFPRAPVGSVSINVWGIACASMISLVAEALAASYVLVTHKPVPTVKTEEPMAFQADQKSSGKAGAKKEL
ncbi:CHD5-like protein-domain-containing protein [Clohesyomyces aquaticus]|uniref:CHD5-like protein-domain-containing protein n=1 Tax=Clohesyomyces aquaticus TaxID=1231657 RepID=A0A1Y1Y4T6_9PLEO|nr:CHD5-like protein-domain-containing protein [Clohesyomyces aquaticus]